MRVLIACEYSGRVRQAFRNLGHDAWSCDLHEPAEDGSPWHRAADALRVANEGGWDLMIAHPPCTYLSSSGLHWNLRRPERAQQTEESLDFVRKLMKAPIKRIAVENPIGCIGTRIRPADQTIQPWQFGHDASKATCLWLKGLPLLQGTKLVEPRMVCCGVVLPDGVGAYGCPNCNGDKGKSRPRWANQTDSGQNCLTPSADRWKERSRTYEGIAQAMAEQWGNPAQMELAA